MKTQMLTPDAQGYARAAALLRLACDPSPLFRPAALRAEAPPHVRCAVLRRLLADPEPAVALAALRALATEGIQRGHMNLHARRFEIAAAK